MTGAPRTDEARSDARAWAVTRTATMGGSVTWAPSGSSWSAPEGGWPDDPLPTDERRPLRAGDLIGRRYRLERRLGAGGFGQVWRAVDTVVEAPVAVKLCPLRSDSEALQLRDEVTALQWAGLPGIVRLLDDGAQGGRGYLVMALVEGWPFPGRGAVPLAELTARLLEVLARLHGIGIVHGDLKPGNVFVDAEGHPTVLDLGIARGRALRMGDAPCDHLTWRYAAPEQRFTARIDARSDLYSVGVMVREALGAQPAADPRLAALVEALLQIEPERRPQSAEAALRMLGGAPLLDGLPLADADGPAALERLFAGPELFLHRRSEGARLLWDRTGGRVAAMRRELKAWLRAGFAWRAGDRIELRPEGLARLAEGLPLVVDHPSPRLPDAAADLLCWIRLALPRAGVERLRATTAWDRTAFDRTLATLRAAGAVWTLADGSLGTWVMPDPAPGWPLERLQRAHAALADSLPADSPAAARHAVAADYTTPGLSDRIARIARRLVRDGDSRGAQALLALGLDLARLRQRPDEEAALLTVCALDALSRGLPAALRHARYLVGRAMRRDARVERLDRLLAAEQAARPARARELLPPAAALDDPDLARWHRSILVVNARREGLDAEAAALDDCARWAEADPPRRRPELRGWLGELRYRQGRYAEAAALYAEAGAAHSGRKQALVWRVDAAAARLECGAVEQALEEARAVAAEACRLRHAVIEVSAVFIARSARYRLGRAGHPRPRAVDAAGHLGSMYEALMADVEAAIAWRAGAVALARRLALRAARRFGEEGRSEPAALYRALAVHCGHPLGVVELRALIESAERCRQPDFGVQILGLTAAWAPAGRLAEAARAVVARGRPPAEWGQRLDILSYHEALRLTGARLRAPNEERDHA